MEGSSFHPKDFEDFLKASFHILAPGQVAIISYSTVSLKDCVILESGYSSGFIALVGGVVFPLKGSGLHLGDMLEEDQPYHISYQPSPISDSFAEIIQP